MTDLISVRLADIGPGNGLSKGNRLIYSDAWRRRNPARYRYKTHTKLADAGQIDRLDLGRPIVYAHRWVSLREEPPTELKPIERVGLDEPIPTVVEWNCLRRSSIQSSDRSTQPQSSGSPPVASGCSRTIWPTSSYPVQWSWTPRYVAFYQSRSSLPDQGA